MSVVYESGQLQTWNAKWKWKWIYFRTIACCKCHFACMHATIRNKMRNSRVNGTVQNKTKQTDTLSKWVKCNLRTLNMITKSYVGLFDFNNYNFSCLFAQKFVQGNCIRSAANSPRKELTHVRSFDQLAYVSAQMKENRATQIEFNRVFCSCQPFAIHFNSNDF